MDGTDRTQQRPPRIALVGAPVEVGAGHRGAIMGPAGLRTAGLLPSLQGLGFEVEDHGDLAPARPLPAVAETPQMRFLPEIAGWSRVLSDRAYALMNQGTLPIFLGGDHSLSMGSVNGVLRHCREAGRELFVLWLDAHTDFNTPATTPSGNMHGMSAALLCGEPGLDDVFGAETRERLDPQNLTILGARSIDREERALLRRRGVEVFDMRLVDEYGVAVLMRRILDKVAARNGVLHVSLDVDFLDPSIAPGVGTTVPGGATYREAHLIMEMLYDSGLVGSLDVVELNPFLDDRGKSALLLVDLVSSLFGRQIIDRVGAVERAASGAQ
ncbi:arginase [Inquilinus limosus]|uniref:Arginase n=1 Tax=Inquilinus limosus TaxID=171674 RepID=A0A211ZRF2_9PROT|nr:arginase [Inquilinus limosus]OWJ67746.1 arginase [Inquilinus limosus]